MEECMSKFNENTFHLSPEQFETEVESLIRRVGTGLPEFEVQRLEKIQASDGVYEIDVTARFEVLGARFLILIEFKNHKNSIKREVVQVLYDRLRAVGAHKGMIFSTAKFQKGAIEYARTHRIALIQIVDGRSPLHFLSFSCVSNNAALDSNLRRMNPVTYKPISDVDVEK
jgi:restriction system protein